MGSIEPIHLRLDSEVAVRGAAALAAEANGDVEAFQRRLTEEGIETSTARGLFPTGVQQFLNRLLGRRLVADLGTHVVRAHWLGFHVPRGGSGSLTLKSGSAGQSNVGLKVMGLGGGAGLKFTLEDEDNFGKREHCINIGVQFEVKLSTWAEDGASEPNALQVDVESVTGHYIEQTAVCPICAAAESQKPLRARSTGQRWDLTGDPLGLTKTITHTLEQDSHMQVGLQIPVLDIGITPSVEMRRTQTSKCSASYTFPGGSRIEGYQMLGYPLDLPVWLRS